MLNKLAVKLSNRLLYNNVISADLLDIYVYGFELIISSLINTLVVLLSGVLLNKFIQTITFLFVFILLRSFSGGYHADTYIKCSIATFSIYAMVMLLANYLPVPWFAFLVLGAIGVLMLAWMAPIKNPNKRLTLSKIRKFKIISLVIFLLFVSAGMLLCQQSSSISSVIFFTLVSDLMLMLIKNKKERRKQNEGT